MARNKQLVRCLQLQRALRRAFRTLDSLAQEFGVTTRTIRRDLDALEEAHEPVLKTADINGQSIWHIVEAV
jgi:predicted DNA-binding transcriptional regulator YafY